MFVHRCWYVAAWSSEIVAGKLAGRKIINEPVVLYRTQDGSVVALEDRCCHRFAPLSLGRIEGDDVRCMYHGMKYDKCGICIEIPGQALVPQKARVKSYPVVEKHGWIWVWMGEAALADPDLVPAAVGPEDPDWTLRCGQMDYQANYLLLNDNLTDFTHLSYVHAKSFGTSEEFARTRPVVTRIPRGIRVQRWLAGAINTDSASPLSESASRLAGNEQWQTYDYLAPGVLLMYNAAYPPGTAERLGRGEPHRQRDVPVTESFTSQAVTPMTDSSSRYFFSWGPRRAAGSDAMAAMMYEVALIAFGEDKDIIEAQQRVIDMDPQRKPLLSSADLGPTQMRRVIEDLLKAESAAPGAVGSRNGRPA